MNSLIDSQNKARMVEILKRLAVRNGFSSSRIDGVQFIRADTPSPRAPVSYDPSIIIVAQGRKIGYLDGEIYTYDPYNYLVLSVPLPFECETTIDPNGPLLALSIRVDLTILGELLLSMDGDSQAHEDLPRGIYSTSLTPELVDAAVRLLECLESPIESKILGTQVVREIIYRVLTGSQGGALRAAAAYYGRFRQISRVLMRIHADYSADFSVDSLAELAGMSVSAFHHNFKTVTGMSPLQYLKSVRLHKARILLLQDGLSASSTADIVGYESLSQFSREFKRFFGSSPTSEAKVSSLDR